MSECLSDVSATIVRVSATISRVQQVDVLGAVGCAVAPVAAPRLPYAGSAVVVYSEDSRALKWGGVRLALERAEGEIRVIIV